MSARVTRRRGDAAPHSREARPRKAALAAGRHHGNRFGRSEEAREAVMEAVDDLLLERGFAALTIEAVAARAGVGKQTIYRWWSSKSDLLFDAFLDETREELAAIDAGTLRADLVAHLEQSFAFYGRPGNAAMFRALAGQAQLDPAVRRRFLGEVLGAARARDRIPFERARARGEWPEGAAIGRAADEVFGPVLARLLLSDGPLAPDDAAATVDRALRRWRSEQG